MKKLFGFMTWWEVLELLALGLSVVGLGMVTILAIEALASGRDPRWRGMCEGALAVVVMEWARGIALRIATRRERREQLKE